MSFTSACGFPQGRKKHKAMVYSYVNSIGKVTPFRDRRPGHDWVLNFERRHYGKLRKKRRKSFSKVILCLITFLLSIIFIINLGKSLI